MSPTKQAWSAWDSAWELNLTDAQRLERLQQCATSDFIYTNPKTKISGDLEALSKYITPALAQGGDKIQVRHLKWFENNERCALQWEMIEKDSGNAVFSGWSYGKGSAGQLSEVADFW